jgi:hypothetical protein
MKLSDRIEPFIISILEGSGIIDVKRFKYYILALEKENEQLKQQVEIERELKEDKEKTINVLLEQIDKMKNHDNCKYANKGIFSKCNNCKYANKGIFSKCNNCNDFDNWEMERD